MHTKARFPLPFERCAERVLELLRVHPEMTRQEIFDCYLAATMLTNTVTRIYPYNAEDCRRFTDIEILTP